MDELISRLTYLTYEFFGIILPGLVCLALCLAWWAAMGDIIPATLGPNVPRLTIQAIQDLPSPSGFLPSLAVSFFAFLVVYFLGHFSHWIARSGRKDAESASCWLRVLWMSLTFRVPKPADNFNPNLQELFEFGAAHLGPEGRALRWGEFYPVARHFITDRSRNSLIATYQNKYTLHRSFVAIAALIFWCSITGMAFGVGFKFCGGVSPHWAALGALIGCSVLLVWGFSASYRYHWQMFGNSVVTEAYSIIVTDDQRRP